MTKNNKLLAIFVDLIKYVDKVHSLLTLSVLPDDERPDKCHLMIATVCCASTMQYHKDSIRPVWAHHDLFYTYKSVSTKTV